MQGVYFQGTSAIALDAKGRMTVPVRQRDLLLQTCDGQLTLTKHPDGFLWVMPRPLWHEILERLMSMSMSVDRWRRMLIGSAADLDMDASARVLVPPELREFAGLDKELRLIGNGRLLELWDAGRHRAHEQELLQQPMPDEIRNLVL